MVKVTPFVKLYLKDLKIFLNIINSFSKKRKKIDGHIIHDLQQNIQKVVCKS